MGSVRNRGKSRTNFEVAQTIPNNPLNITQIFVQPLAVPEQSPCSPNCTYFLGLSTFLQAGEGCGSSGCEKLFGILSTEEWLRKDALAQQLRHCYTHSAI
jgi:hypothetical protein